MLSIESQNLAPIANALAAIHPETLTNLLQQALASRAADPTAHLAFGSREAVDTATAAHHLNRRPQTLRTWAMRGTGPIRPLRIHGRLAWPVAEIRRVLGVAA